MIKINNLNKEIDGTKILNNISLQLEEGKIYGFVGRNGAGKSILFKVLARWLEMDNKSIIEDKNYSYGVLIEHPSFMEDLTGIENILEISKDSYKYIEYINKLFKELILNDVKDVNVAKYSVGMKQKLGIIQALYTDPDVIILDEAFSGLDKVSVNILREKLLNLKKQNKIILLSSHIAEDINILADEIIYLEHGEITKIVNNIPKDIEKQEQLSENYIETNYKKNKISFIYILLSIIIFLLCSYIFYCNYNLKLATEALKNKEYEKAYSISINIPYTKFTKIKEKINYYNMHTSLLNFANKNKDMKIKLFSLYRGIINLNTEIEKQKDDTKLNILKEIKKEYYNALAKDFNLTENIIKKYFETGEVIDYEKLQKELLNK